MEKKKPRASSKLDEVPISPITCKTSTTRISSSSKQAENPSVQMKTQQENSKKQPENSAAPSTNTRSQANWAAQLEFKCKRLYPLLLKNPEVGLLKGVQLLASHPPSPPHSQTLQGQPFDSYLLGLSSLFKKSRTLFLKGGGSFEPSFISSARTLSSSSLLHQKIEFSPIEREFFWAATDRFQKLKPEHLITLRTYTTSLFHEQNHRILWNFIPSAPRTTQELRRYLNFIESLVITADMALGDELKPHLATLFYHAGATYDPGTDTKSKIKTRREYRNYLHATTYATYLNLEMYHKSDILKIISTLYSNIGSYAEKSALRSLKLDQNFIQKTNPNWQHKHRHTVIEALSHSDRSPLHLDKNPMDNRVPYLWTEQWLELLDL